jgi:serpin B
LIDCKYFSTDGDNIEKLVNEINTFVENITKGNIKTIIGENDITDDTCFILTNAIYFKNDWENQFDEYYTRQKIFNGTHEKRNENFMHIQEHFEYFENSKYQMAKLPYKNHNYAFYVVLPKNNNKVVEHNILELSSDIFEPKTRYRKLFFSIPKFTKEYSHDLIPHFKHQGVNKLFQQMDSSNMSDLKQLYISMIKQKVQIEINEGGTSASAANIMVCMLESCSEYSDEDEKPVVFNCDHPFTYYIVHLKSKTVLFSGIYE